MSANSVPRLDGPPCTVTSLDQCLSAVGLPQDLHGFLGVISVIPPGGLGYFQSIADPLLAPALLGLPAWHLASCLFTKLPKFTRTCRDLRSVRLAQQVPCALSHGLCTPVKIAGNLRRTGGLRPVHLTQRVRPVRWLPVGKLTFHRSTSHLHWNLKRIHLINHNFPFAGPFIYMPDLFSSQLSVLFYHNLSSLPSQLP